MPSISASFAKLPSPAQWAALIALSAGLVALFELIGLPATFLLGPMLAAICIAVGGGSIRVWRPSHFLSQTVIGCLIAGAITPEIVGTFLQAWPIFLAIAISILTLSSLIGWLIAKYGVLPGTTAVWGTAPGAASAMMLMAGEFGADARIVAFMQYLRVAIVAGFASLLARFWIHAGGVPRPEVVWFPPLHWLPFAETIALALIGGQIGRLLRLPAGALLVPMIAGAVLHAAGIVTIELPPWLLATSYAFLGWNIGLGFTRQILSHAARALPQTLMSIFAMISFSGALAFILVETLGVDPLTAYLATSPGGMDSVAIIAASTPVNISFVMAMQTVRFLIVLLAGPPLARLVASRLGRQKPHRVTAAEKKLRSQIREDEAELD